MRKLWSFLQQEKNRQVLGWLGGGIVLAFGLWAAVTFFNSPQESQKTYGPNSPAISHTKGNISITNDPAPRDSGQ